MSPRSVRTFTEQLAMLDGAGDVEERREGTAVGLERLEVELR